MKQAIVTGAGQGLGAAIAAALDVAGYRVGVLDVDAEQVAASAAGLQHGVALRRLRRHRIYWSTMPASCASGHCSSSRSTTTGRC